MKEIVIINALKNIPTNQQIKKISVIPKRVLVKEDGIISPAEYEVAYEINVEYIPNN